MVEHLYIHWPFCGSKCHYCDFVAFEGHSKFIQPYHNALCNEIKTYSKTHKGKIKTIFFGGGTPSLCPIDLLKELFELLRNSFDLSEVQEVTIEVNPRGVAEEKLKAWKELGINRLSVGVQVLNNKVLENLNRNQSSEDVYSFMKIAPRHFNNISADLILGLPGVENKCWQETIREVVALPVKHVSVYMLMIHNKTPLYFRLKNGELNVKPDDAVVDMYNHTVKFLNKYGLFQYEMSNFALDGYQSLHNIAYWDYKTYRGLGLGAVSFDGQRRLTNIKNLTKYLDAYSLESDSLSYDEVDVLLDQEIIMERLMLGLRRSSGMGLHSMLYLFRGEMREVMKQRLKSLEAEGLISLRDERVALTLKGMALENEIVLTLLR